MGNVDNGYDEQEDADGTKDGNWELGIGNGHTQNQLNDTSQGQ